MQHQHQQHQQHHQQRQQQQQVRSNSTSRPSGAQGLNLGGILGAWRRLSSAKSPRGFSSKGRKSAVATAEAAAATVAASLSEAVTHAVMDRTPESGPYLPNLCALCSSSFSSCSSKSSSTRSSGLIPAFAPQECSPLPLQQRWPSDGDSSKGCLSCGSPLPASGWSAAASPAGDRSTATVASDEKLPPQLPFQRWASLLSLPTHRLVLLRVPRYALQVFLGSSDVRSFPCYIEAVLQPPLHLLLQRQHTAAAAASGGCEQSSSEALPPILSEARRAASHISRNMAAEASQSREGYLPSLAQLSSIAPRAAASESLLGGAAPLTARSLSLLLRWHSSSASPICNGTDSQQNACAQQQQLVSRGGSHGLLTKRSSSGSGPGCDGSAASSMPVAEGYEHLSSWLFNAPDRRLCEVVVTPDRLVLVSGVQQQQMLMLQRKQDHQQQGNEGVIGITKLARWPEESPRGADEFEGAAQWRLIADLLGLPPPWQLKAQQQQEQEEPPRDSQQQHHQHQQTLLQQQQDDSVDVYSSMELAETHKITSRKNDARLLCFYFNATKVGSS